MEQEELKDIEIVCKECGKTFVHTVRDQIFYKETGYENVPKSCIKCRKAKKDALKKVDKKSNIVDFGSRKNDNYADRAA